MFPRGKLPKFRPAKFWAKASPFEGFRGKWNDGPKPARWSRAVRSRTAPDIAPQWRRSTAAPAATAPLQGRCCRCHERLDAGMAGACSRPGSSKNLTSRETSPSPPHSTSGAPQCGIRHLWLPPVPRTNRPCGRGMQVTGGRPHGAAAGRRVIGAPQATPTRWGTAAGAPMVATLVVGTLVAAGQRRLRAACQRPSRFEDAAQEGRPPPPGTCVRKRRPGAPLGI